MKLSKERRTLNELREHVCEGMKEAEKNEQRERERERKRERRCKCS